MPGSILPSRSPNLVDERYRQIVEGVARLGRWTPEQCRCIAQALYAEVARDPGIRRVDDVVMGNPLAADQRVFAVYRPHGRLPPFFTASAPASAAQASIPVGDSANLVDEGGYVIDANIIRRPIDELEHGALEGPHAIVMHRTGGGSAASALASFSRGTGTHFLIDKDGTIYQTASLELKTHHVGRIRARCAIEGTCTAEEQRTLDAMGFAPKAIHDHEKDKPYPQRFPKNEDSVGIEVVSRHTANGWEPPTLQQRASIARLVGILQQQYGLGERDVYEHDVVSYKTQGEGAGLYQPDSLGAVAPDVVQPRGPTR